MSIIRMAKFFFGIFLFFSTFLYSHDPSVFIGVVVKNYDQLAPYFLKCLNDLTYDKQLVEIQFDICSDNPEIVHVISEWASDHKNFYNKINCINHSFSKKSAVEKNKFYGTIKDSYLAKTKLLEKDFCFILSSDVFLLPHTLTYLIEKNKPIIAPLLRAIPEAKDPFRNFFFAITEQGYYKHHPDYDPIANRKNLGTFEVPCISYVYLIRSDLCDKLSFTKNFVDWEFLSFSKNARESCLQQYLCNEREFGSFLHFFKEMTNDEEKAFTLANQNSEINRKVLFHILEKHFSSDSSLRTYAQNFPFEEYAIYRIQNEDVFYVDEVNDYIKNYIIKQGLRFEEYIHDQFKRFVKPGSTVLDIGGHIGIHSLNLSKLVGDKGIVHVFEPQSKLFCELAINMYLNNCKNVELHHNALGASHKWVEMYIPQEEWTKQFGDTLVNEGHGTVTEKPKNFTGNKVYMLPLDSLELKNISLIKLDVEGYEMEVIRGGLDTITRDKPILIVEIFNNEDLQKKIQEIEHLGYTHTPLGLDNYLFIPADKPKLERVESKSYDTSIDVVWEGSFFDLGSLSHVNRSLCQELAKIQHLNLTCISSQAMNTSERENWKSILSLFQDKTTESPRVTVRHSWPPNWNVPKVGKWVVIQPWEFGALPEEWLSHLEKVDEIWVPTSFVRNEYLYSGVPANKVKVVPNGYDNTLFHPNVKPLELTTKKKFKFLFVGGTIFRKGCDILLSSYLKAFTKKDDVCLVIKDFGTKSCYQGQTYGEKIKEAQKNPNAPEILYLDKEMPAHELAGLYKSCDCLVIPYRGEGFALPVLEAMACGLPVIVTEGGATSDFVTSESGWFIPSTPQLIGHYVGQIKLCKEGWLLEPNAENLTSLLFWLIHHPEEVQKKGLIAAEKAKNWSWENAASIAAQKINQLFN